MEPEAAVRQFYQALSTGETVLLDEILANEWEDIPPPPGAGSGRESFRAQGLAWMHTIFPDLVITNEDIVVAADGSKVAVRSVVRGTQSGAALGIPATGRRAEFQAFEIQHVKDGVIVKTWHLEDFFGLAGQLGAQFVPPKS